jgi:hypothetical protein
VCVCVCVSCVCVCRMCVCVLRDVDTDVVNILFDK